MDKRAEIGIIGGTGVYDPALLKNVEREWIETPFGYPSDAIIFGTFKGRKVAFLPRHGAKHSIPPHGINFRANIWALKELGVTRILAPQAVGGMQEETKPGDFVIADQFIDRTWGRASTFYEQGKVCHISMADPFCNELRKVLIKTGKDLKYPVHEKGTYVCIQGPRFSTRAESFMFRDWGADIIGMTLVPECVLAREAEICYASIAMVTDYDCWKNGSVVSHEKVVKTMKRNLEKVKKMLSTAIPKIPKERKCACKSALNGAIV